MTVVTLAALYGAGGSVVAPALARALDVPLLGRPEEPESDVACDGRDTGNLLSRVASLAVSWGTPAGLTTDDLLPDEARRRELEQEVRAFAEQGRGVILGRGAAALLRGRPGALHVLLEGPVDARVRQAMAIEHIDRAAAERRLHNTDRFRRAYVEGLYGVDPEAPGTFHVVLDSTALALELCVEIIADIARRLSAEECSARRAPDGSLELGADDPRVTCAHVANGAGMRFGLAGHQATRGSSDSHRGLIVMIVVVAT